jgi:hypothetical protein
MMLRRISLVVARSVSAGTHRLFPELGVDRLCVACVRRGRAPPHKAPAGSNNVRHPVAKTIPTTHGQSAGRAIHPRESCRKQAVGLAVKSSCSCSFLLLAEVEAQRCAATLPVGETGVARARAAGRGGGSPALGSARNARVCTRLACMSSCEFCFGAEDRGNCVLPAP